MTSHVFGCRMLRTYCPQKTPFGPSDSDTLSIVHQVFDSIPTERQFYRTELPNNVTILHRGNEGSAVLASHSSTLPAGFVGIANENVSSTIRYIGCDWLLGLDQACIETKPD